jgi:hypothetical protein
MTSTVIDSSIGRAGKVSRARIFIRLLLVIAALAVVFAMTLLPDPTRSVGQGQEARKNTAPMVSKPAKPGAGSNPAPSNALHSV